MINADRSSKLASSSSTNSRISTELESRASQSTVFRGSMGGDLRRRFPVGAEVHGGSVSFRVWAPRCHRVAAVIDTPSGSVECPLSPEGNGYFEVQTRTARAGSRYQFRLDDGTFLYPDPVSRFQPEGPHGPSEVIDSGTFPWTDYDWTGVSRHGQVIYELHVGTFTPQGTWAAAEDKLPWLADFGITLIELMPVAEFSGEFGWGYDGVNLFAPTRLYGRPDEFRHFVDRAHALGLGVILDVVYNHFGPDGNYHHAFSRDYFTDRYSTDWGEAINFGDENSRPVREFVTTNGCYWITEFHLDGLRIDATQNIYDSSDEHILQQLCRGAREAAGGRSIYIVGENESQDVRHVVPLEENGFGMDSLWNDDLHHTALVALTGHSEAYYSDYQGTPQEFISAIKWGYLYQGQWYEWQQRKRGTSTLNVDPASFVSFLENHDQVANSGKGQRPHQVACPGRYRALTALILLSPATPMLFQGQEFGATTPFFYFAAHRPDLARLVDEGRKKFLAQFPSLASPKIQEIIRDPAERSTFELSKLDWEQADRNVEAVALHRDLLRLRKSDPTLQRKRPRIDGAVLSPEAFLLRYFDEEFGDRLLLVNLGRDLRLSPCPEPLLAEPAGQKWTVGWSSEDPQYGGLGTPPLSRKGRWFLPGNAAMFLTVEPSTAS
jgi:maltooligosyltrehalose trehalohydrolase